MIIAILSGSQKYYRMWRTPRLAGNRDLKTPPTPPSCFKPKLVDNKRVKTATAMSSARSTISKKTLLSGANGSGSLSQLTVSTMRERRVLNRFQRPKAG
jgi:hypothetical protein